MSDRMLHWLKGFNIIYKFSLLVVLTILLSPNAGLSDVYYKKKDGVPYYTDMNHIESGLKRIISNGVSTGYHKPDFEYSSAYDYHIKKTADRFGLDPNLVKAVIKVESDFNKYAKSKKGAMGMMQLMPGTAKKLRVANPWNASENINGGAKYLDELMDMFDEDLELVLAAYNAGENAVIRHGYKIPPYNETVNYVDKVKSHYKYLKTSKTHGI